MEKYYKRDSFEQGKSVFDCSLIVTQQVNGKTNNSAMEKFLSIVEGTTSSEISNINQMNQNLFKEFLQKNSVWDYYSMSRNEYTTKSASEKEILIIKYYNEMYKGKSLYFIFLVLFPLLL